MADFHWADEPSSGDTDNTSAATAAPSPQGFHWADEPAPPGPSTGTEASQAAVNEPILSEEALRGEIFPGLVDTARRVGKFLFPSEAENPALYLQGTAAQRAALAARVNPEAVAALGNVVSSAGQALTTAKESPVGKFITEQGLYPREVNPAYWVGRYNQEVAKLINPKGALGPVRTAFEAAGGAAIGAANVAEGFTTPLNIGIALAPELLPVKLAGLANKALAAYFLQQGIRATPGQLQRLQNTQDVGKRAEIITETLAGYIPGLAFLGKGRAARARTEEARARGEEELPSTQATMTRGEFIGAATDRLDALKAQDTRTPAEDIELRDLEEGLGEHGDVADLARKRFATELSDVEPGKAEEEPAAKEPVPEELQPRYEPMTEADFRQTAQSILDDLNAKEKLSPDEIQDVQDIVTGLKVEGALPGLAHKWGINLVEKVEPEPGAAAAPAGPRAGGIEAPLGGEPLQQHFGTRAEADNFVEQIKDQLLSADVTERKGFLGVTVTFRLKPPTEGAAVEGGEIGATQEGEITEGGLGKYPGVPLGANVPTHDEKVREGGGKPPSDSGGVGAAAAEPTVAAAPAAAPKRTFTIPADAFGKSDTTPVASYVMENGGLVSKSAAKKAKKYGVPALWDDSPKLANPSHGAKIWRPDGEMPDVMAANLHDAGLIPDADVNTMYRALERESKTMADATKAAKAEAKGAAPKVKQAAAFGKAEAAEEKAGAKAVPAHELDIGATINIGGEDFKVTAHNVEDMTVTLEDGKKYGVQEVGATEIVYGEIKERAEKFLTPEEQANLSESQKRHLKETGELLSPEEAAKARSAKARQKGTKLPSALDDELANAEQSAAEGDKEGAKVNVAEVRRILGELKKPLSPTAHQAVLGRVARVEAAIGEKPAKAAAEPSTAESADQRVVRIADRDYVRDENGNWHRYGAGMGRRLVGNKILKERLDAIWEARQAIAQDLAEQQAPKKPAAKPKTTAAPVPTTRETPSREEIGKGEPQAPPGTKIDHPAWGEGEVVGPGKQPGTIRVRFPDGKEYNFPGKNVLKWVKKPEVAVAPEPGARPEPTPVEQRADARAELEKRIADAKAGIKSKELKPKEKVALRNQLKKDELALRKLKAEEKKAATDEKEKAALQEAREEQEIATRKIMRESLAARVKKEKFPVANFMRRGKGGVPEPTKAQLYKGLAIWKDPNSTYKPWRVNHESSGKDLGQFDTEADAKAFAVRATGEEFKFDFTRPWQDVQGQRTRFGSARFAELVTDPYGWLADAGIRLRRKANNEGGFIGPGLDDAVEFGRRLYQRGINFRDWAINMTKHLGEKIMGHLRDIWDSITGRNILAHARQRGGASPGGPSPGGRIIQHFDTRAEADQFISANQGKWASHSVIQQSGSPGVDLAYRPKPPGPGPSLVAGQSTRPVVTKKGAVVLPKYIPSKYNAPPTVNAANGGTTKPPPPGSTLGPTPPGSNPPQVWMNKSIGDWQRRWEAFWPGSYAAFRLEPSTPVINIHQKWIAGPTDGMSNFFKTPWFKSFQKLTRQDVVDADHLATTRYAQLRQQGQGHQQALLNAIAGNPLRDYFVHREQQMVLEKQAAKILNVAAPGSIEGPYLPRLTNRDNQIILEIGGKTEGVVSQLRRSLGRFDASRVYDTMHEGIMNGVQYTEPLEAVITRERVGQQFIATARALKDLEEGGVIYKTPAEAYANSKDKFIVKMEGFGGDNWWIRNRQEARFINQNLNNAGKGTMWATFNDMVNNYTRNPNLWNPLPHITKNMFFKYILAGGNPARLMTDWGEFLNNKNPALVDRFHKVFTMPKEGMRMREMIQQELTPSKLMRFLKSGLGINKASQHYIFEKADPAMRYSLWKKYLRQGLDDQHAANHVFLDLIRYDENSGGLNFWKSIPFNWFSTWRTGTYVTMYKALTTHPIRTLLFFGAVEYMREMIYRKTGKWTHLPIDYLDSPLATILESLGVAKKQIALGRNPVLAYKDIGLKTGAIAASTLIFGPGGGQAPTTIGDLTGALQGDPVAGSRMLNMFWGLSELFNIPGEWQAYQKDHNPSHLADILSWAALGTHEAVKYEPRRLGKYIFPEWLPGMAYTPEQKGYAAMREERETKAMKAAKTYETRHGALRGLYQGSKEQQVEDLLRGAGVLKERNFPRERREPRGVGGGF
jgi:hypothetical protein